MQAGSIPAFKIYHTCYTCCCPLTGVCRMYTGENPARFQNLNRWQEAGGEWYWYRHTAHSKFNCYCACTSSGVQRTSDGLQMANKRWPMTGCVHACRKTARMQEPHNMPSQQLLRVQKCYIGVKTRDHLQKISLNPTIAIKTDSVQQKDLWTHWPSTHVLRTSGILYILHGGGLSPYTCPWQVCISLQWANQPQRHLSLPSPPVSLITTPSLVIHSHWISLTYLFHKQHETVHTHLNSSGVSPYDTPR